jgi:AcrR family transcriptional regulator
MPRPNNKETIRRAAVECFAEKGYDATRIADIAHRAGLSVAALYNHYPSVQALAQELYLTHFGAYAAELAQIAQAEDTPVEAALRQVVRATLARYRQDPAAFNFVSQRLPSFLPELPTDVTLPLTSLHRLVVRGQAHGTVRDGDPTLLATMFLGALLRVFFLNDYADLHGFTLMSSHDPLIEHACLDLLRPHGADR